jgi:hypothetical protein
LGLTIGVHLFPHFRVGTDVGPNGVIG